MEQIYATNIWGIIKKFRNKNGYFWFKKTVYVMCNVCIYIMLYACTYSFTGIGETCAQSKVFYN